MLEWLIFARPSSAASEAGKAEEEIEENISWQYLPDHLSEEIERLHNCCTRFMGSFVVLSSSNCIRPYFRVCHIDYGFFIEIQEN